MALYGTHIRFALDVKDYFEIVDIKKYISGTVYPDSRYYSKIKRELTHDRKFEDSNFYHNDDFKKGWAIHLLYDHLQFDVISEIFPTLFSRHEIIYGNDHWITRTVIKILQDLDDIKYFDITSYLYCLDYIETPNEESQEVIKNYNNTLVNLYKKSSLGIDDYKDIWIAMGMEPKVVEAITAKYIELSQNIVIMESIKNIYPRTLEIAKSQIRN